MRLCGSVSLCVGMWRGLSGDLMNVCAHDFDFERGTIAVCRHIFFWASVWNEERGERRGKECVYVCVVRAWYFVASVSWVCVKET